MFRLRILFFILISLTAIYGARANVEDQFYEGLATDFWLTFKKDTSNKTVLDDAFVLTWLAAGEDNRHMRFRSVLAKKSGTAESPNGLVDLDWDQIKIDVSFALDIQNVHHGLMICENNRGTAGAINIGITVVTIVASVFTLGTAGAAIQAGRIGAQAAAKAVLRDAALKGATRAVRKAAQRTAAQAAVRASALETLLRDSRA